jgi:hypothetical protein
VSEPITDAILDEIEALDREATGGPWRADGDEVLAKDEPYIGRGWDNRVRVAVAVEATNAVLIARYRDLAPALAREVRQLRDEVVGWRKLVETEELLDGIEERRKERRKRLGLES